MSLTPWHAVYQCDQCRHVMDPDKWDDPAMHGSQCTRPEAGRRELQARTLTAAQAERLRKGAGRDV